MFLLFEYGMNNMSFKLPCKVFYYCYITLIFLVNFRRNADIYIYFTPVRHICILKYVFLIGKNKQCSIETSWHKWPIFRSLFKTVKSFRNSYCTLGYPNVSDSIWYHKVLPLHWMTEVELTNRLSLAPLLKPVDKTSVLQLITVLFNTVCMTS